MKMYAVPRGSTSFLKKNIVLGKFTVRLYSRSNPTLSGFILPQPHWSLSELKILVKSEKVIDDILLDKLAKMSCICLDSASLKVSRQDIKDDINTILNCSKILKNATVDPTIPNDLQFQNQNTVQIEELRNDAPNPPGLNTKKALMANSPAHHEGFFVVPKIRE